MNRKIIADLKIEIFLLDPWTALKDSQVMVTPKGVEFIIPAGVSLHCQKTLPLYFMFVPDHLGGMLVVENSKSLSDFFKRLEKGLNLTVPTEERISLFLHSLRTHLAGGPDSPTRWNSKKQSYVFHLPDELRDKHPYESDLLKSYHGVITPLKWEDYLFLPLAQRSDKQLRNFDIMNKWLKLK